MNKAMIGILVVVLLTVSPALAATITAGDHILQWSAGPTPIAIFTTGDGLETAFGVDLRVSIAGASPGPFIDSFSLDERGALFEDPQYHAPFPHPQEDPGPQPTEATGTAADFRPLSSPRLIRTNQTLLAVVYIDTSEVDAAGGTWDWLLSNSLGPTGYSGADTVLVDGTLTVGQPNAWDGSADSSWNNPANWTNNIVPNGIDAVANFLDAVLAPSIVTVNSDVTVGTINFNSADGYTIGGPAEITFNSFSGNARINVQSGNHTVSAPVSMDTNMETVVGSGNVLSFAGEVAGSGDLIKNGLGTLALDADNTHLGETRIRGGILHVTSNNSLGHMSSGLRIDGGTLRTSGSFSGTREVVIGAGGATLDTTGTTSLTLGFTTRAVVDGDITKTGTGTLVLPAGFDMKGALTASAGTVHTGLGVLAALGGPVTLGSDAVLEASGMINRLVYGDLTTQIVPTDNLLIGDVSGGGYTYGGQVQTLGLPTFFSFGGEVAVEHVLQFRPAAPENEPTGAMVALAVLVSAKTG